MTDRDVTEVLERLVGNLDHEVLDWDTVIRRANVDGYRGARQLRWTWALVPTMLVAAAVVALLFAAPWNSGTNIVDRAAAAILSPTPGRVLHEDVRLRVTILPADVRVARSHGFKVPHGVLMATRFQIWLDGTVPQRFRLLETSQFRWRLPPGPPTELGGRIGGTDGLSFDRTAGALYPAPFSRPPVAVADIDPTTMIKNALRSGRAKPGGKASIDGRPAIKILLTTKSDGQGESAGAYYVDPKTYRPLRIVLTQTGGFGFVPGFPLAALAQIQQQTMPPANGRYTFDFHDYRSLPATPAARRAADIRAAHPDAKIL